MHRAVELDRLPLEEVDALRLVGLALEDTDLGFLDVAGQPLDHGLVVVDDLVEHGPDDGYGARIQELRTSLEALPSGAQHAGLAVTHRDRVPRPGKDVNLAEIDLLAVVVVARGTQDYEVVVLVALDLGPLVGLPGVLDRELVHREVRSDLVHLLLSRVVDAEPDEAVAVGGAGSRLGHGHPRLVLAGATLVMRAVDDHRRTLRQHGFRAMLSGSCPTAPSACSVEAIRRARTGTGSAGTAGR
jgi:hypothetical protein